MRYPVSSFTFSRLIFHFRFSFCFSSLFLLNQDLHVLFIVAYDAP